MSPRRFRVAFSFAGEKRDFVAQVAAILATRFDEGKILYDKFHKAEFSRADLAFYLPALYHDQSDLIVAVFCPDYRKKEWCGLEWNAIFDLLKKGHVQQVMPTRFGHVEGEGLYSLSGYTDLHHETPDSAATLILERLALNEGHPKDHYTAATSRSAAAPSTTTPNNLPRLQPFFGRAAELRQIHDALAPEARTWGALIDGPGGMGKTSLAIRAAQECPPGLFDRIIFVSVKDWEMDDDGLRVLNARLMSGLQELFTELARELGLADFGKSAESERPRLLLEALRQLKVLLILDNLESLDKEDRDPLFTFIKRLPGGCKAILTSRRRLAAGAEMLILERLEQDAALATLAELAKHNKLLAKTSEAERIVLHTHTGGNPLLLRWTAGQLGRGSCRTFTDALTYLRSCPEGNDPLEFVFGDLAREFTDEETKVLAALTYFTQPATVEHIATVAGAEHGTQVGRAVPSAPPGATASTDAAATPSADGAVKTPLPTSVFDLAAVETALRTLANRSLVVPDQEERAYTLVPMVADFLRKKCPEVVAETGNRLENRAYALIVENGYQKHDRFPILDAAWPTVAPALTIFLAGQNERLQSIVIRLRSFLEFTGRWDELLSVNLQAERKALGCGDFHNAGWRAYHAGCAHHLRGEADAVLACAERASAHWTSAQSGATEQAFAVNLLGTGYKLKNDFKAALATFRKALDLHRSVAAESINVAISLNDVAGMECLNGDPQGAERDAREALRISRVSQNAEGIATLAGNLAALTLQQNDWPVAETLAQEALFLSLKLGRKELIASNQVRLARALVRQDRKAEALPYAQQAVKLFTLLGSPDLADAQTTLQECQA